MRAPFLLLVDDNADDVALARRALERGSVPAQLTVAASGKEALDLLAESARGALPKALFLDLNMPGWHGFDVLKQIRADERTAALPVVILTTSNEPSDIEQSYELGANSFVTKPVDFKEFSNLFAKMSSYWLAINQTV